MEAEILPAVVVVVLLGALFFFIPVVRGSRLFLQAFWVNVMPIPEQKLRKIWPLLERNSYFAKLTDPAKLRFSRRTVDFMRSKTFRGMHGLTVSNEMRLFISASAVQLTFGLKRFKLEHYDTIYVFPAAFYLSSRSPLMKGGATPTGSVFFSWKDFKKGYQHSNDGYNLGLHEMAHALKLDTLHGEDFDHDFSAYLDTWTVASDAVLARMRQHNNSFMRPYALTNRYEFMAVSVEYFFEAPEAFRQAEPRLYYHLCRLLNQDPLNVHEDYAFHLPPDAPDPVSHDKSRLPFLPHRLRIKGVGKISNRLLALMVSGGILFFTGLVYLRGHTLISDSVVYLLLFLFGSAFFGVYKWFRLRSNLPVFMMVPIAYAGVGVWSLSLLLGLNMLGHWGEPWMETYLVNDTRDWIYIKEAERKGYIERGIRDKSVTFRFQEKALSDYTYLRTFYKTYKSDYLIGPGYRVNMTFRYGILGIPVLTEYEWKVLN